MVARAAKPYHDSAYNKYSLVFSYWLASLILFIEPYKAFCSHTTSAFVAPLQLLCSGTTICL